MHSNLYNRELFALRVPAADLLHYQRLSAIGCCSLLSLSFEWSEPCRLMVSEMLAGGSKINDGRTGGRWRIGIMLLVVLVVLVVAVVVLCTNVGCIAAARENSIEAVSA